MATLLLFFILMAVVVVAAIAVIVVVALRATQQRRAEQLAPAMVAEAMVIDKRSEITGGGETSASQRYYVTFQFPDGNRAELSVTGAESGMLTMGDRGTLQWKGTRFIGFARQILR